MSEPREFTVYTKPTFLGIKKVGRRYVLKKAEFDVLSKAELYKLRSKGFPAYLKTNLNASYNPKTFPDYIGFTQVCLEDGSIVHSIPKYLHKGIHAITPLQFTGFGEGTDTYIEKPRAIIKAYKTLYYEISQQNKHVRKGIILHDRLLHLANRILACNESNPPHREISAIYRYLYTLHIQINGKKGSGDKYKALLQHYTTYLKTMYHLWRI